ncbi:MAG: HAD family hydrolase [Macellibacteroides fermentans]|uniref:HAD family hydrolase n=1 Tax=Macellibacteroides fermentans TaxID=879969 RepID=UPI003AD1A841
MKLDKIKVIGFDADDTLWINESYFLETEQKLYQLLAPYASKEIVADQLYRTEMQNMPLYGYGVKAYILSVMETAIKLAGDQATASLLHQILIFGKEQLEQPVELLPDVHKTLNALYGKYKLIVVTKGDLLDQERKLLRSGIAHLFHHVEIISDKTPQTYRQLLNHLDIQPEEFLMTGNSMKSDILPPLSLGCYAIHVPYKTTWAHETAESPQHNSRFKEVGTLWDIVDFL